MDVKKPPDDREGMLVYKNQRLAERVEEQRREIRQLEARVDEYDRQQEEQQETLLCVNRLWNQLNHDIAFLISRTVGNQHPFQRPGTGVAQQPLPPGGRDCPSAAESTHSNGPAPNAEENGTDESATVHDFFLDKLLRGDDSLGPIEADARARQAKLAEGYSEVESVLRARMSATTASMAKVLDLLNTERDQCNALRQQLGAGLPAAAAAGDAGGATVAQDLARLAAENDALRAQTSAHRALARSADAAAKSAQSDLDRERARIRRLETELADKIEAVAVAQRKLAASRASAGGMPGGVAASSAAAGGASTSGVAAGNNGALEEGERVEDDLLNTELDEVRKLLKKRNQESEADKEMIARLQREVRDVRAALQDESHVLQTRLYQLAQKQISALGSDIARLNGTIDALQRDLGIAMQTQQDLKIRAESVDFAKRALRDAEARIADLENKHAGALATRNEVEVQLHRERERFGNQRTVEELSVMVGTLQKEKAVMKGHMARHKGAADRVEAAAKELLAAQAQLEAKEIELGELQRKLDAKQGQVQQLEDRQQQLQGQVGELRLFVEMLLQFCDDPRDLAEVRLSERSLQQQLQRLEQRLADAAAGPAVQKAQADVSSARQEASEAQARKQQLTVECIELRKQVEVLTERIKSLKDENEAYMSEIETIGSAYEDMQAQNTRLLAGITERDELNNKLSAERMRTAQQQQQLVSDCSSAGARIHAAEAQVDTLKRRVQDMEAQLQAALSEATAARDSSRMQGMRIDGLQRDLREKDDQLAQAHSLLEAAQRQAADRKRGLEEEADRLTRERTKRQRLDEDVKVLQAKVAKLRGQAEVQETPREVQEEVQGLRSLLRCSVCSERRKDTIITKCYHMFCSRCIQRNLETRHRKCPGCNIAFGNNDVKSIYFS